MLARRPSRCTMDVEPEKVDLTYNFYNTRTFLTYGYVYRFSSSAASLQGRTALFWAYKNQAHNFTSNDQSLSLTASEAFIIPQQRSGPTRPSVRPSAGIRTATNELNGVLSNQCRPSMQFPTSILVLPSLEFHRQLARRGSKPVGKKE